MSLKRNVIATYAGQTYTSVIGVLMLPLYVRYMGIEAYGLIGFYILLQAWFQMLDIGLTPTMAREAARFSGDASRALALRRLLRALEIFFVIVAVSSGAILMASSSYIANSWLKLQDLRTAEVELSVKVIAAILGIRWICGLYRGAISGFERLVWLSGFNIAVTTARFVLVIPLFIYVGSSPTVFFAYQLMLAVLELTVLASKTYWLLPKVQKETYISWQWEPLQGSLKFALSIAFTSAVWVLVTQTDKLMLSKMLQLTEYAYFTLAVMVASGVTIISAPISTAVLPRLTKQHSLDDSEGLARLYRNATQLVAVVAIPAALVLSIFAEQALWTWSGDHDLARQVAPVLALYALGNGILAISAFPYYLQVAKGDLKLHLIGNIFFIFLLIPAVILATRRFGVVGSGYAWLGANFIYFSVWVPVVHHRMIKGLHSIWLLQDIFPILIGNTFVISFLYIFLSWEKDRVESAIQLIFIALLMFGVSALTASNTRRMIKKYWASR